MNPKVEELLDASKALSDMILKSIELDTETWPELIGATIRLDLAIVDAEREYVQDR